MRSLIVQRLCLPFESELRSSLRRASTIATTNVLSGETDTPVKHDSDIKCPVRPFHDIPGPRGVHDIPYIGMAFHFKPFTQYEASDLLGVFRTLHDKYGDIFKIRMGGKHAVFVSHPDYVADLYKQPFKYHERFQVAIQDVFYKRNNITARGLSILQGEEWIKLRKPVQEKLLKPANITNYVPLVNAVANDFLEKMEGKLEVHDAYHELLKYTSESIGMLTLNRRVGCIDGTCQIDFSSIFDKVFRIFQEAYFMPIQTFRFFRTKMYREFESSLLVIYDFVLNIMKEQTQHLQKLDQEGKLANYLEKEANFLYAMLSDSRMTPVQVGSVIIDIYTGAITSTANGILFVLCDLALHSDKQEILFEEINQIVGNSSEITKDQIGQMSYLRSCLKESQRLKYPVFLGGVRFLECDGIIGDYQLPKGTQVFTNNELMCNDERFFPRHKEYIPERWLRDDRSTGLKGLDNSQYIVRPFGVGPRQCPGQRIAEIQILMCIAKIIQKFEVSLPVDVKEIPWTRRVFATPVNKVNLHMKLRHKTTNS